MKKKTTYNKNIANFEAVCRDKNFSKKPLFLRSELACPMKAEALSYLNQTLPSAYI